MQAMADTLPETTSFQATFAVAADHPSLPGHFPGRTIVPGVVILDEITRLLARRLGAELRVTEFPAVKFIAPLLPEAACEVTFISKSPGLVSFEAASQNRTVVTGSLRYDAA